MDSRSRPSQDAVGRELIPPRKSDSQDRQGRPSEQGPNSGNRDRSRTNNGRRPSGSRQCGKCGNSLTGQFVRALGDTYHLECFTCHDCGKIVASKFFPVPDSGPNQYPLCEKDYFGRLGLLCYDCGGALRGSYITALDRKYHIEHFTCSVCPTVFGASDSYYEHEGNVYCHYHYSTQFAQRCNGCQTSILKQFVEIYRNGQNQHWHPECYMIHKYWNVRLASSSQPPEITQYDEKASDEVREQVRVEEEKVEEKVLWIWRTLSAFEEKSATCISDMLLHVSNGAYMEGVVAAKKFIAHVDLLFAAADDLDQLLAAQTPKSLSYGREAKLLCKKVVAFFQLLAQSQTTGVRRLGVTQELLSLVTGLAHYLKLLIRICLQGSLRLERETGNQNGLSGFLNEINSLEHKIELETNADQSSDALVLTPRSADTCPVCEKSVEDRCFKHGHLVFHGTCMVCQSCSKVLSEHPEDARWLQSRGKLVCSDCARTSPPDDVESEFVLVSKLRQYVHLLRVAHARLLANLRTSGALPHTSEDPNLADYDSSQGHRLNAEDEPRLLRSDTRSKSYGGSSAAGGQNSFEQTLGDIKRLRSQRLEKHLSMTNKKARSSTIIDGPEGIVARNGEDLGEDAARRSQGMQIVQDRDANGDVAGQLTLGVNSLALDDIPRIVASQQAKEQRPNASRYARGNLIGPEPKPRLVNGHRRDFSGGQELERAAAGEPGVTQHKKYFSELSALEYFIVRHIAVLSMEPLLEGQFNQEELLDLIETKKNTFWSKFTKGFNAGGTKPPGNTRSRNAAGKKKNIFGRHLETVVEFDGAESTDGVGFGPLRIPALVQDALSAMRNMDMSVEGVFRKNGNIRRLKELSEQIDREGGDAVDLTKENAVQVAALLKKFLRELPDPVLTFKLHRLFIAGAKLQDEDNRRRVMHLTCCLMPKVHRDTMEVLFAFLQWASSFHTVDEESGSKMDIHNLATVIAPNILYAQPNGKATTEMDTSFLAIEAVNTLIECNEEMAEVPDDIVSMLSDSSVFDGSPDLTTKEILKRWGEIGRVPQATITNPQAQTPRSREGKQTSAMIARVDSQPQQWPSESSVRHVGGPGNASQYATPNHSDYDLRTPSLPYAHHHPNGSSESQRTNGGSPHRHSYRSSPHFPKPGQKGHQGPNGQSGMNGGEGATGVGGGQAS